MFPKKLSAMIVAALSLNEPASAAWVGATSSCGDRLLGAVFELRDDETNRPHTVGFHNPETGKTLRLTVRARQVEWVSHADGTLLKYCGETGPTSCRYFVIKHRLIDWTTPGLEVTPLTLANGQAEFPVVLHAGLGFIAPPPPDMMVGRWSHLGADGQLRAVLPPGAVRGAACGHGYCFTIQEHLNTTSAHYYDAERGSSSRIQLPEAGLPSADQFVPATSPNEVGLHRKNIFWGSTEAAYSLSESSLTALKPESRAELARLEAEVGGAVTAQNIFVRSEDRRLPVSVVSVARQRKRGILVFAHGGPYGTPEGLGSTNAALGALVRHILRLGFDFAFTTYHSSNPSSGRLGRVDQMMFDDFLGTRAVDDVTAVGAHFQQQYDNVILLGHSLGGYLGLLAGSRPGPSPFRGIIGFAAEYDGRSFNEPTFSATDAQDPMTQTASLSVPYLLIHGNEDQTARIEKAREWLSIVLSRPSTARLVSSVFHEGNHDIERDALPVVLPALTKFLRTVAP